MVRHKLAPRRRITKRRPKKPLLLPARLSPATPPPTLVFTAPDGTRGEVLRLCSAKPGSNHTHVVLLPGNPGVIEYYRATLAALWRRLPADVRGVATLHAVGYPGHDLRQLNGLRTFTISEHVDFLESYIGALTPGLPRARVVLLGHSYGGYAAVRVAERLAAHAPRVSLVMLMPALWQMGVCAGWLSRVLLRDALGSTSWLVWGLTAVLPPVLRDALIRAQRHQRDADGVTRTLVDGRQRGLFRNVCALGRDEMRCILEPGDMPGVALLAERAFLVYADVDKWCPPEGRRRILKAFGPELVVERAGDGVTHGFCLFEDETQKVVKVVAPWLCERIRAADVDSGET